MTTIPWALILGTIATIGLGYEIEIVKNDGSSEREAVNDEQDL